MGAIASQITSLTIVYSTVYSDAYQRKHQSSASLAFVRGIHRGPVNSPHKWPVTRKMFPFDDVIMQSLQDQCSQYPWNWNLAGISTALVPRRGLAKAISVYSHTISCVRDLRDLKMTRLKLLRLSDTYICQQTKPPLVQIMTCGLFSA